MLRRFPNSVSRCHLIIAIGSAASMKIQLPSRIHPLLSPGCSLPQTLLRTPRLGQCRIQHSSVASVIQLFNNSGCSEVLFPLHECFEQRLFIISYDISNILLLLGLVNTNNQADSAVRCLLDIKIFPGFHFPASLNYNFIFRKRP